jgi:cardiolipin synthase
LDSGFWIEQEIHEILFSNPKSAIQNPESKVRIPIIMHWAAHMTWFAVYIAVAYSIRLLMVPVILRRQLAPGASVAWLGIIFLHPYIGVLLYMLLGETRLGPGRVERHRELVAKYRSIQKDTPKHLTPDWTDRAASYEPMILQAEKISGLPVLAGNAIEFLSSSPQFIERLITDIDAAKTDVNLLYYIFAPDRVGEVVTQALERAAKRGVHCRLLMDAVGSRPFLHHHTFTSRLASAGVQVAAALPAMPIQRRLPRMDLRNHRKLAIIDSSIAFVGSNNVINPDYGGRRGAPWVDLSGRITGPIVTELSIVFAEDWAFETNEMLPAPSTVDIQTSNACPMQVIPTGPSEPEDTYRRVLLAAIQCARHQAVLTTPYFVPDEPTLVAMLMAVDRGVEVSLIVPLTPDHLLTAAAGRAHFDRLMSAGVCIWEYRPGLIHAKTVTIDDAFAVFGSANLDVRSFNLNFELSVLLYGAESTARLRAIQQGYLADSSKLDLATWGKRTALRRYTDSAISLLSPLL